MKKVTPKAETESPRAIKFRTTLLQGDKTATGIQIPQEVIESLGPGRRPLVRVTINGYTYRNAVAVIDGNFMVGVSAENRQAAGVQGGDEVDVTIELDLEPRTVEMPKDFKVAMSRTGALKAFEVLSPSMRKEYVRQVEEAKTQETRDRRISKIVSKLTNS
jgi:hypothetical protein